jgi:hypothetical protein
MKLSLSNFHAAQTDENRLGDETPNFTLSLLLALFVSTNIGFIK